MKINTKNLLKDRRVLYAIAGLSALNMIGWMSNYRHESLIVFFIVMLIATRFTKNMILIIGSALVVANLLMISRNNGYMEGMEGKDGETGETGETDEDVEKEGESDVEKGGSDEDKKKKKNTENFGKQHSKKELNEEEEEEGGDSNEAFSSGKHDIDFATTLDQAYGRIDKVLGADGGKKWGDHMDKLFKKQNSLLNNLNKMEPVLEKMGQMAKKTKGMEGMLSILGGGEK